jgi:hypothetical protein
MGMDAMAYLWYGTKPIEGLPKLECIEEINDKEDKEEILRDILTKYGIELIRVASLDVPSYALAIKDTDQYHNWDYKSKPFEIHTPSRDDREELFRVAREIGWPTSQLGW